MPPRSSAKPEIEIKLRVGDIEALARDLRGIGARSLGRVLERNTLYDTGESHFRKRGCLLRLRTEVPAPSRLARGGPRRAVVTCKTPMPRRLPLALQAETRVRDVVASRANAGRNCWHRSDCGLPSATKNTAPCTDLVRSTSTSMRPRSASFWSWRATREPSTGWPAAWALARATTCAAPTGTFTRPNVGDWVASPRNMLFRRENSVK